MTDIMLRILDRYTPDRVFSRSAQITSLIPIVIAMVSLSGSLLSLDLSSINPALALMSSSTAVAFVLCGLSLEFRILSNKTAKISLLWASLVVLIALFGLAGLLNLEPVTALGLMILGFGLAISDAKGVTLRGVSQFCFVATTLLGLTALIGYIYHVDVLYRTSRLAAIPIGSALSFLSSGLAGLFVYSDQGLMKYISSRTLGGVVARRMLPFAVLIPCLFGWLRLRGQYLGYYGTEFGLVLFVASNILVFSVVIWVNARLVDRIIQERDVIVTERKELERRERHMADVLAESTLQFKHLVQSIHDYAISRLDLNGHVTSWNLGAENILGYKDQEILGQHFSIFYPKDDLTAITPDEIIKQATELRRFDAQTWHVRKDRTRFWATVIINGIYNDAGQLTGFAKITRDVTAWKQASDQIIESEERLQSVVNNVVDGIVAIDDQGRIQSLNTAAERLFGYSIQELAGQNVNVLMPSPFKAEHDTYIANYLRTGKKKVIGIGREVVGLRKDGTQFSLELAVGEFHQKGQRFFTGIIRDITERKENEKKLADQNRIHQESLESKVTERTAQLSAANEILERTISELKQSREDLRQLSKRFHRLQENERSRIAKEIHDELGQMLAVIKIELSQLKRQSLEFPAILEKVSALMSSVDQTVTILRRVSSDLKPVVLEQLGLVAALEWLVSDISKRTGVQCSLKTQGDWVEQDSEVSTGLFRVIQEAMTNALKHSGTPKIDISLTKDAEAWIFEVRDCGCGILPDSHRQSSSLGMIGMRERVLAIGGTIAFEGVPTGGTLVKVRLPLTQNGANKS